MEATKKLRQEQIKRYNEYEKSFQDTKDPKDPLSKRSGSRIGVETEHLLKDAAKTNDLEEITELLALESEKISQQVKNEALFTACSRGSYECAQLLLIYGSDVDYQDEDLWTSLHISAACGHCSVVQLLFDFNADSTLLDVDGNFAIDHASDDNIRSVISAHMAECGVYEEDLPSIRTRLFKAMNAAVRSAITRGKDLTQLNKNGVTPLHTASAYGYYEIVQLLVEKGGVPVDVVDIHSHTPLHVAQKYKQGKVVQYLLEKGCTNQESLYNTANDRGATIDHSTAQSISTPWKLKNIKKEDGLREGLWLKQHSFFDAVIDTPVIDTPPVRSPAVEMIYDTCPDIVASTNRAPKQTIHKQSAIHVEDMYDSAVNVLSLVNNHKRSRDNEYEDIAVVAGNIKILNVSDSQESTTSITSNSPRPRPYEQFVRQSSSSQAPTPATAAAVKKSPPKLPPKKLLNKSKSVQSVSNNVPEAWLARMVPKPRPIPVVISRRDSTPTSAPPPRPPRQKASVSASALLPSIKDNEPLPPPLPPRSPKSSYDPPSYDAILRSPEQYPISPPPTQSMTTSRVPPTPVKNRLKKATSVPPITSGGGENNTILLFTGNHCGSKKILSEERITAFNGGSPRPYKINNKFQ